MPQNLHTHQFFDEQISFSYQKLKFALKDGILSLMTTSRKFANKVVCFSTKSIPPMLPKAERTLGVGY